MPSSTAATKARTSTRADGGGGDRRPTRDDPPRRRGVLAWVRSTHDRLGERARDIYGIALLTLGVLAGIAMFLGSGAAVGAFLHAALRGTLGVYGYLVPVALVGAGVQLLRPARGDQPGRVVSGAALVGLAAVAGWHLLSGNPSVADGVRSLWPSGGVVGALVANPLHAALGTGGALVLLTAVLLTGVVLATDLPLRDVMGRALSPLRRALPARARTRPTVADATLTRRLTGALPRPVGGGREVRSEPLEVPAESPGGAVAEPAVPVEPTSDLDLGGRGAGGGPDTRTAEARTTGDGYVLPSLDLLDPAPRRHGGDDETDRMRSALERTFEDFGINATVARSSRGPTVTTFEVELGSGTKVHTVTRLTDDLSYALAAPELRVIAPMPGKSAIGVEVPNSKRDTVAMRDVLAHPDTEGADAPLAVALGADTDGHPTVLDLSKLPHLLIAGATGSGKSVLVNTMITSIMMRNSPSDVKMLLVDPKQVELSVYADAPHLISPVVTDKKRAADALSWALEEMDRRYELLRRLGLRGQQSFNAKVDDGSLGDPLTHFGDLEDPVVQRVVRRDHSGRAWFRRMPYLVIVVDELADLMMVAKKDVEESICRIAQLARAVGIHMVLATQRPSVDVVTGLIKANIPARIALATASHNDSRTILDTVGAEKLVGDGDMLYLGPDSTRLRRVQGCWVSEDEVRRVVGHCAQQQEPSHDVAVLSAGGGPRAGVGAGDDEDTQMLWQAARLVVDNNLGSTSMLQRKLKVGFARAGRLMDELEEVGVVGPSKGSKAREVLLTSEELDALIEQGRG